MRRQPVVSQALWKEHTLTFPLSPGFPVCYFSLPCCSSTGQFGFHWEYICTLILDGIREDAKLVGERRERLQKKKWEMCTHYEFSVFLGQKEIVRRHLCCSKKLLSKHIANPSQCSNGTVSSFVGFFRDAIQFPGRCFMQSSWHMFESTLMLHSGNDVLLLYT